MRRRSFLALTALAIPARGAVHGMQLHLSCGALGIRANQREAIDLAARHGFDAVDADGNFLGGLGAGELSELVEGMRAKKVAWGLAGMPVDFRKDDVAFATGIRTLPTYAAGLQRAGVRNVTTWVLPSHADRPYLANFKLHAQRLREVAKILDGAGLRFGLEYVAPQTLLVSQRYPFVHTMAETRDLISEIGQSNVGLVLDSWHWYHAGDTAADIAALQARDVVSVDLNDAPRDVPKAQMVDGKRELPAATGVIDVKAFLRALEQIQFQGPVRAEPFNEAVRRLPADEAAAAAARGLNAAFAQI